MTTDLQRYQWTTTGMRRDDSIGGAMWFYRGMDVDGTLGRYDADLDFLKSQLTRIREALATSDSASLRIEAIYEVLGNDSR